MPYWVWLVGVLLVTAFGGLKRLRFVLRDAPLDNAIHVWSAFRAFSPT